MNERTTGRGVWSRPWLRVFLGVVGLALAVLLLVRNERRVVHYRTVSGFHGGVVDDLGSSGHPGDAEDGRMVRIDGMPKVVTPPRDPMFQVSAGVTRLRRTVAMFQWRQVDEGGHIHYEMDWVDHPVDATHFAQPAGHANPSHFPVRDAHFLAPRVTLNGFELAPDMVAGLHGALALKPDFSSLPPNLAVSFQNVDGELLTCADPLSPRLGDLRVSWQGVPPQVVTVIARVQGHTLVAARGTRDGHGYVIRSGNRPLAAMLPDLPPRPPAPMFWRGLALLAAWIGGALLVSRWIRPVPAVLAGLLLGAALLCAVTAALWWSVALSYGAFWGLMLVLCATGAWAAAVRGRRMA